MATTEPPVEPDDYSFVDRSVYSGWLLRAFPESDQTNIVLRALLGSTAIIGVEYVVEVLILDLDYWQNKGVFFTSPDILLSAFGLVFALVLVGQWGARYVELWGTVRPVFDVPDRRYDSVIRHDLDELYGRDHVPFLLFVGIQVGVYTGFDIPAGFFHVGFFHFFAAMILYTFYRHTITIGNVTDLELVDLVEARSTLSEIADFSVVVSLSLLTALAALVVWVGVFLGVDRTVGLFYAVVILSFVGVALLVFVIPVVLLHEALVEAKRERLGEIYDDYDLLFETWKEGDVDGDPSVALDILETRRQNVNTISTWPYHFVSVGKLVLGSIVPTVISVLQAV